ncbi:MAG TPA: DEAD/DEAH box helicase family protein [Verrucomicrobiae bacterium]|nr:DEAD/DEAH box helicase family protein [Verrucomicrobiae bacterium]
MPEASDDSERGIAYLAVDDVIPDMTSGAIEVPFATEFFLELSDVDSNGHGSDDYDPYDETLAVGRGHRELPTNRDTEWDDGISLDSLRQFRQTMGYDAIPQPQPKLKHDPVEMPDEEETEEEELSEFFIRDLLASVELQNARTAPNTDIPPALQVSTGEQTLSYWVKDQNPGDLTTEVLGELSLITISAVKDMLGIASHARTKTAEWLIENGRIPKPIGIVPYGDKKQGLPVWSKQQILIPHEKTIPQETPKTENEAWRAQAACLGSSATEYFFAERGENQEPAKSVCRGCSARQACLESALAHKEKHGIWGGTNERERRVIRRRRSLIAKRAAADGTLDGLDDHDELTLRGPLAPEVQALVDQNPALESIAISFESADLEVRDDQIQGVHAVEQAIESGKERVLYQMYPGGGKTNMAAIMADRWLSENPEKRVLYLCHDTRLLSQARARFKHILGDEEYTYGTFTGEEKDWDDPTFMFASFQTMQQQNWQEYFADQEFDLVIVDESHHSKAATYEAVLDHFLPRAINSIAMSGTIKRHDMRDIQEIWGAPVYSKTFAEAMDEKRLVWPEYIVMEDPDEEETFLTEGIDPTKLNRRIFIEARDKKIVAAAREEVRAYELRHGVKAKPLIFDTTIAHADVIARLWSEAEAAENGQTDITANAARTLHTRSKNTLEAFRNNEFPTLVTVNMLNEGIDITDVNVIIFLAATDSEPKYIQQLARGLRKKAGKPSCLVLDFPNNWGHIMMGNRAVKEIKAGRTPATQSKQWAQTALQPRMVHLDNILFTFQATRVDFVQRVKELDRDPMLPDAMSVKKYARDRSRDFRTVVRYMRILHMIPLSLPNRYGAYWLPVEYQQELDAQAGLAIEFFKPGEIRLPKALKQLGVGQTTVDKALNDGDIRLPTRNFDDGGPPGLAVDEATLALLEANPRVQKYKEVAADANSPLGEDEESVYGAALSLNVSKEVFIHALQIELGISPDDLLNRSRSKGQPFQAVKKAHTAWITGSKIIEEAQPAPTGAVSVHQLAVELGTADKTLKAKAAELGILPKRRKGARNHYDMFFVEDLEPIRAHSYFNKNGSSKYRGRTKRKQQESVT